MRRDAGKGACLAVALGLACGGDRGPDADSAPAPAPPPSARATLSVDAGKYGYEPNASIFDKPAEMPGPASWFGYIRVKNLDAVVQKVKDGGGTLLNGPMEVPGGDWIAQFADPHGGLFAVHVLKNDLAQHSPAIPEPGTTEPAPAEEPARQPKPKAAKPKAAKKKYPFARRQPVFAVGAVSPHESIFEEVSLDGLDGADHPGVVGR